MAVDASNARIFGGDLDAIWLAPVGTTLPTTIDAAPGAGFEEVGWLGEDGITESATGSLEKKRGHQGNRVVRTRMSEPGTTVSFVALETKALTNGLRYDEKTVDTAVAGVRHVTRGAGQKVTRRAAVIDVFDADDETVKERWVIPVLEISPNGDRAYVNSDIAAYPFTGELIGDYEHFATEAADVTP